MQGEASDHLSSLYRDNKRTLGDASYEALVEATDRCVVVFKLLQAIAGFVWPDRVSSMRVTLKNMPKWQSLFVKL